MNYFIVTILSIVISATSAVVVALINSRAMHYKSEQRATLEREYISQKLSEMESRLDELKETDSCCSTLHKDVINLKKENGMTFKAMIACLSGLEQLGCNHEVTATKKELESFVNEIAHA